MIKATTALSRRRQILTLKAPITTVADDKFCDTFPNLKKGMKYHALFVIFEKAAKFEIAICCKLYVTIYGLMIKQQYYHYS